MGEGGENVLRVPIYLLLSDAVFEKTSFSAPGHFSEKFEIFFIFLIFQKICQKMVKK